MRQGNKLTALAIRSASAPALYGDGHGLYLQVSQFGTKAWLFRCMKDGVARKMGLGAIHTVSLAEARKRAAEARLKVHDGLILSSSGGRHAARRGSLRPARSRSRLAPTNTSKRTAPGGGTQSTLINGWGHSMRLDAASAFIQLSRPR
jgi:hypothetical protein